MQVLATASPATRAQRIAVYRSAIVAVFLVLTGAILAYVLLATPILGAFTPTGRPSGEEMAVGMVAWGFAVLVPAGFLILGVAKLVQTVDGYASLRPRTVAPQLAQALGPDHVAASDLILPGGRRVPEMILGPFGIAILGDLPPASVSRHRGSSWEIRGPRGSWVPIENPLERASRDAERVRGWVATDDRDFLVKTYAAVVTDDPRIERTPSCAVVRTAELGAWLEALPPQRGLTPQRRERLLELVGSAVAGRP
jgi:hypothetical protein